jgi:hypothetical protein
MSIPQLEDLGSDELYQKMITAFSEGSGTVI